ncbi:MAG: ABC-F family ATP-binding cassette domain-containing protein [Lachnospiraceae bacterium]
MNLLTIEHIHKVYGEKTVFEDVSCGIQEGDKIGIIGINGTGKTTLLRILAGVEQPDEGKVVMQNNLHITWLPQNPEFPKEETILSYVMAQAAGDWNIEGEAKSILNRLGFTAYDTSVTHLSGGQKKRVALARAVVNPTDVLVLDEPTNHLDNEMVVWLEDYLKAFRGVVVMVTHDRYFLDRVTNRILEIDHGSLYSYPAGYEGFLDMKALREEMEMASERKRKSILRMELEWASRGCRARSTKQRARLERLEDLKNGKAPAPVQHVELDSIETRMGKKTIEFSHIRKTYGDRVLIRDFSYILLKNQRLGIIGPNGCGKSTLLKMLIGQETPDAGTIEIGETIKIGYFAQETPILDKRQRVIDYIKDTAEYILTKDGRISASQLLERFLFDSAMQYTPLEKLSGGELRRLYLCKVLMESPNVLILDEPTNDLDIPTLTILEDYLDSFVGIIITVSHDRYFLDNVVDRIFAFEGDGLLQQYEGGYTEYREMYKIRHPQEVSEKPEEDKKEKTTKTHEKRLKFSYKEQKEYETIDDDIAALEDRLEKIEKEYVQFSRDFVKLGELEKEKAQKEQALEEKLERWEYLNELAEAIEAQKK